MRKLLHAGFRRYTHSIIFWIALAATVILGIFCGYEARQLTLDDIYIIAEFIVMAVLITWLVGREFDEGVFRNKVVSGHSKGAIYLSELILGIGVCILFYLIFAVGVALFNGYIFSVVPSGVLIRIFVDLSLANIGLAAILVTVSCLVPHRAIIAIVNILLVIGMMLVSYELDVALEQPEYDTEYDYEYTETTAIDGTVYMEGIEIPGTERQVKNENYLDGWKRTAVQTVHCLLPTSHLVEDMWLVQANFGYEYYNSDYSEDGETYETSPGGTFTITKEEDAALSLNLIYSAGIFLIVSALGFVLFRRKGFK